jgi:DNA-binding HxlR family transcriptional regulator
MGVSLASMFPDQAFTRGCPTREVLDHVMSKWAPLVLASLADGEPQRWSELRRRAEGVSEKMLAQTLRTLEQDGLVLRVARPVVPPHVEYSLTPLGQELVDKLVPLMVWVAHHADQMLDRTEDEGDDEHA